ncbi:MAG: ABC transporter permease [Candidatus Didemnitutus sp.]|nr:ABC transporter permease [Candidatus Didemnitutus sp.]
MFRRLAPFAADLFQHRELLWQFTLRNVELRHKGSHLGLIWSLLNPLLMLGLYVLVFGYIFGGSFGVLPQESRVDYGLGIFFGLTLFHFVAEVLGISPTIIVGNPNFVKKVVFPLEILPAASVLGAVFHMMISLALLTLGIVTVGPGLSTTALWLPVIMLPIVLLMLGVSWFFSALGVFFRDVGQMMQFLTMALMFASAVFYPAAKIVASSPAAWSVMRFNPVLLAIELARDAALWGRPINLNHLGYLFVVGIATCYLGHAAFRKMKPAFADVL